MSTPRIGCVKYLNARPLIHGWPGAVDFDHPSVLCQKLARAELEVALVSSIECLRRPHYFVADGVALAAFGPVYSVIVAHKEGLSRIEQVQIDPASETSVALLRCLLEQRALNPRLVNDPRGADCTSAFLLIGDQAIRFRQTHPQYRFWDLAEEWKKITALPFVFALWLIRPEVPNTTRLADQLRALRDRNLTDIDRLIAEQRDPGFARRYFRDNLRFNFGPQEKAGLREFHRRCLACEIDVAPRFELHVA